MARFWLVLGCIGVIGLAGFLRFDGLADRPMHADEATGARMVGKVLEGQGYAFDATHFHGPLQVAVVAPVCRGMGATSWVSLEKFMLRVVPAGVGVLVVVLPWLWWRRFGGWGGWAAGVVLATSPLLVYYSRMMIHEMLLVAVGLGVIGMAWGGAGGWQRYRWWGVGVGMGLMHGIKETVILSGLVWVVATLVLAWQRGVRVRDAWREWKHPLWQVGLSGFFVSFLIYTRGGQDLGGWWRSIATFWEYQTGAGHDREWWYYAWLLVWPKVLGGRLWTELGVLVLALGAVVLSERAGGERRWAVRWLAYSAVGHVLVYSLISYKTPWLMALPWAQVCWLAGLGVGMLDEASGRWLRRGWLLAVLVVGAWGGRQALLATGRYASDERNPYAYVPTQKNVESLEGWLQELDGCVGGRLQPMAVVGHEYWPLPWYLRKFSRIGYWPQPVAQLVEMPVVFAMVDVDEQVGAQLSGTHVVIPRGLRAGVPMMMYIRQDLWDQWQLPKGKESGHEAGN